MNWPLLVTLIAAVLGSNVIVALITLHYARPKTASEAQRIGSEAGKIEAEGDALILGSMQGTIEKLLAQAKQLLAEVEEIRNKYLQMLEENAILKADKAQLQEALDRARRNSQNFRNEVAAVREDAAKFKELADRYQSRVTSLEEYIARNKVNGSPSPPQEDEQ